MNKDFVRFVSDLINKIGWSLFASKTTTFVFSLFRYITTALERIIIRHKVEISDCGKA